MSRGAMLLSQAMAASFVTAGAATAQSCRPTRWQTRQPVLRAAAARLRRSTRTLEDADDDRERRRRAAESGLEALLTLLHLQGVAADREQIRHRLGTATIGAAEMLRCAKDLGLKARAYRTDWSRLAKNPLPGIALLRDGTFMVIAKASDEKVLVQSPQDSAALC